MTDITIKEHDRYYDVIDSNSKIDQYSKDSITDLNLLVEFLIDEFKKANDKQNQWFEKYWEEKKKVNRITDVVNGDVE